MELAKIIEVIIQVSCWIIFVNVLWLFSNVITEAETFKIKLKNFMVIYLPVALVGIGVLWFGTTIFASWISELIVNAFS